MWDEMRRVAVGSVTLELPAALVTRQDGPIDSAAAVFAAPGLIVIVDQGPFSDRLENYVGRPGYQKETYKSGATTGGMISFRDLEDGTYTAAAHLPAPINLSVVVQADESIPEQVPRHIIASIVPTG